MKQEARSKKLKVYFAGSIAGGRDFQKYQAKIVGLLEREGHEILTEHVSNNSLVKDLRNKAEASGNLFRYIAVHDRKRIKKADLLVAECSQASLGVGFEICYAAYLLKIPVIALRLYTNHQVLHLLNLAEHQTPTPS